jgi:hypothetical protein
VTGADLGFDSLMASLSAIGADSRLPLPGVDEPTTATAYVRQVLALLSDRGIPFDSAWSSTINRLQAPQGEGGIVEDPSLRSLVLEERSLLEENRPAWQAAYERRAMTTAERAVVTVRAWNRLEAGTALVGAKRAA